MSPDSRSEFSTASESGTFALPREHVTAEVIISNDGATILQQMKLAHPADAEDSGAHSEPTRKRSWRDSLQLGVQALPSSLNDVDLVAVSTPEPGPEPATVAAANLSVPSDSQCSLEPSEIA